MSLQDDIFDIEFWFKKKHVRLAAFHRVIDKLAELERAEERLTEENKYLREAFKILK